MKLLKQAANAVKEFVIGGDESGDDPTKPTGATATAIDAAISEIERELPSLNHEQAAVKAQQLADLTFKTKLERQIQRAVVERLRKHSALLQNPPVTHVDGNKVRQDRFEHFRGAEAKRTARIEKLKQMSKDAIAAIEPGEASDNPVNAIGAELLALSPAEGFLAWKNHRRILQATIMAACDAEVAALKVFNVAQPLDRSEELAIQLKNEHDATEAARIHAEIRTLRQPEAIDIAAKAKRGTHDVKDFFTAQFSLLKSSTVLALKALLKLAVEREAEFHKAANLKPEKTALSRKYETAIAKVTALHTSIEALSWWGVTGIKD